MQIIIAESQAATLRALVLLLQSMPDLQVIGEVSDQKDLLIQVKNKQPDLVILDMELPDKGLQELVSKLRELDHRIGVIVLARQPDVERQGGGLGLRWAVEVERLSSLAPSGTWTTAGQTGE